MPLPQKVIEGLVTKADKIRALDKAGMIRSEIASFLGIRYQHVRNTLVQDEKKSRAHRSFVGPSRSSPPTLVPLEKLTNAGFTLTSQCQLVDDESFRYTAKASSDAGVYAFAVDGIVMYVGLTRSGLRQRLGQYVYGHAAQRTSARIKSKVLDALRLGRKVEVLTSRPPTLEWNGLPVDGAPGLETGLIRMLKPAWNLQGTR